MFTHWEQWAEALNMVPGSAFYQSLYDDLPSTCQSTMSRNLAALDAKKITKEDGDQLVADYAENPDGLEKVLNMFKPYTPITPGLKTGDGTPKNKAELIKEYDELFASENGIADLQNSNPEHLKALKAAKFGTA
ncbi:MAG: hypothetical protein EOP49_46875 [Sphingobacteriales bacterium]|nr:MAG: hypothetical protein EOP49_46875 [Sphingobacteriales bacterium]